MFGNLKLGSEFFAFNAEMSSLFPKHRLVCHCLESLASTAGLDGNASERILFACDSALTSIDSIKTFEHSVSHLDPSVSWAYANQLAYKLTAFKHIVVTRCFLESVADPRPLLRAFKRSRSSVHGEFVILGSRNYEGLRSWNDASLLEFLGVFDISVQQPQNSIRGQILSSFCSSKVPEVNGLHPSHTDFVLLATEDSRIEATGGIGTYTAMVSERIPNAAILYAAPNRVEKAERSISTHDIFGDLDPDQLFDGAGLVEAVKVLLTKFPLLEGIEVPDYRSLGYRLTQARETGALPLDFGIRIFLHGNIDYLKYQESSGTWKYSESELMLQVKDAKAFSGANEVVSPTNFLSNLMSEEFGYVLSNPRLQRLPFEHEALPELDSALESPSQLIFIGKFSKAKGWEHLLGALKCAEFSSIKEILAFAPGEPDAADLEFLYENWNFKYQHVTHAELIKQIAKFRYKAVFVLPYLGDNHPFAVLEQVLIGTRFVTFGVGGSPELIPLVAGREAFIAEANPHSLAGSLQAWVDLSPAKALTLTSAVRSQALLDQKQINEQFEKTFRIIPLSQVESPNFARPTVDVVTPFFNTDIELVDRLYESLSNQILRPDKWIIVNDGSSEANSVHLENWLADKRAVFEVVILRQENQGLASARNAGLAYSKADYILFIDSDDVLAATALHAASLAMTVRTDVIAVSGFGLYFQANSELAKSTVASRRGQFHKPLGTEFARAISFTRNEFITSCAMFQRKAFADLGGWGEQSKATWEDWSLYLRLTWGGQKLAYLPQVFFGYRYLASSMSRTYNTYFGQRRLVKNLPGFTRLDANALVNFQQRFDTQPHFAEDIQVVIDLLQHSRLAWFMRIFSKLRTSISPKARAKLNRMLKA